MEVISSFTIDHTNLKPGIYVSRDDESFRTFDLRFTEPNKEPALLPDSMHTLEHLMATWFRNSSIKEDVVYVGPMGCLTGMYLILKTNNGNPYTVEEVRELVLLCLKWICDQTEVPAVTPETCGNYLLHDLSRAKCDAAIYYMSLSFNFHSEYTKLKVKLDNGMNFADS